MNKETAQKIHKYSTDSTLIPIGEDEANNTRTVIEYQWRDECSREELF